MDERLAVVLVTDDRYAGFAAVACASMLANSRDAGRVDCHVLYDRLQPGTRERLRGVIERRGGSAHFCALHPWIEKDQRYRRHSSHFLRLLSPEALPPAVDRFLYLDCDVVVHGDVLELAGTRLNDKVVAACQDYLGCVRDAVSNHQALGMEANAPYFNSGVMVVDRGAWLSLEVSDRVLECTRLHSKHLYAQGRFCQYDQYGLNIILYGQWARLDAYWNYGAQYPFQKAGIVHFNGHGKPWSPTCAPQFRRAFYAYLEDAGWQDRDLCAIAAETPE